MPEQTHATDEPREGSKPRGENEGSTPHLTWGPPPFVPPDSDVRLLAIAASEVHGAAVRQQLQATATAGGSPTPQMHEDVESLQRQAAISEADAQRLHALVALVASAAGEDEAPVALRTAEAMHQDLIMDEDANPIVLAIVGIAANSLRADHSDLIAAVRAVGTGPPRAVSPMGRIAGGDVAGALSGASLGARWTRTWQGTVVGALAGAILCSVAQAL